MLIPSPLELYLTLCPTSIFSKEQKGHAVFSLKVQKRFTNHSYAQFYSWTGASLTSDLNLLEHACHWQEREEKKNRNKPEHPIPN